MSIRKMLLLLIVAMMLLPAIGRAEITKAGIGITWTVRTMELKPYTEYMIDYPDPYDGYYGASTGPRRTDRGDIRVRVPLWLSRSSIMEPDISLYTYGEERKDYTAISIGITGRVHPFKTKIPYLGARMIFDNVLHQGDDVRLTLGPLIGCEFFFIDRFSLGVEASLDTFFDSSYSSTEYITDPHGWLTGRYYLKL